MSNYISHNKNTRHIYNEKLLHILSKFLNENPDQRFNQALYNLGVTGDNGQIYYNQESEWMYNKITSENKIVKNIVDKLSNEKKHVINTDKDTSNWMMELSEQIITDNYYNKSPHFLNNGDMRFNHINNLYNAIEYLYSISLPYEDLNSELKEILSLSTNYNKMLFDDIIVKQHIKNINYLLNNYLIKVYKIKEKFNIQKMPFSDYEGFIYFDFITQKDDYTYKDYNYVLVLRFCKSVLESKDYKRIKSTTILNYIEDIDDSKINKDKNIIKTFNNNIDELKNNLNNMFIFMGDKFNIKDSDGNNFFIK